MNDKQCKKLRAIAKMKAISWKEAVTQGVHAWKNVENQIFIDPRTINVKDGVFFQRKLHPLSAGAITKKLKRLLRVTARPERQQAFDAFGYLMNSHPELLGIPAK